MAKGDILKNIWPVIKAYAPVSTIPIFVTACIYMDLSKTKKYKAQKKLESMGTKREFDRKINL